MELGPEVELKDFLACTGFDANDQLGHINLPIQVRCGSEDVITPIGYSNYLTEHIQNNRETVIEDRSHFVQMERYQKVKAEIDNFMASLK